MKKKYVLFAAILTSCRLFAPEKSDAVTQTTDGEGVSPTVTQNSAKVSPPLRPKKKEYIPGDVDASESDDDEPIAMFSGILKSTRGEQKKRLRKFTVIGRDGKRHIKNVDEFDVKIYGKDAFFLRDDERIVQSDRTAIKLKIIQLRIAVGQDGVVFSQYYL